MTTSIEEALRSGAVLAEDELVRRGDVLRVLRRLGGQDADLALYGAEDNARAREYGEAAMTRACCAVAIMPTSPDHTPALVALIEERDALSSLAGAAMAERDKAKVALTTAEAERDELLREKERLAKLSDRYGVALMMISAGCSQPQRFAGNILDDKEPVEIDLEDCDEDHR